MRAPNLATPKSRSEQIAQSDPPEARLLVVAPSATKSEDNWSLSRAPDDVARSASVACSLHDHDVRVSVCQARGPDKPDLRISHEKYLSKAS